MALRVKDIVRHLASFSDIKYITINSFGELLFQCEFEHYDKDGIKPFLRRKVKYFGVLDGGLFFIKVY